MTAKEKANKIGNKFYQGSVFDYNKEGHLKEIINAKERAKICVNEIIDAIEETSKTGYWHKVLEEIDLL